MSGGGPISDAATVRTRALVLLGVYFISGGVGLAYQVLWARLLSLQFGVSIFGVVITAAAFMAGLGAGAMLGNRGLPRRPLLGFAVLEGGIAVYALALPWLMQGLDALVAGLAPQLSLPAWYALHGVATWLLIGVPALAMGVGFAWVLQAAREHALSLALVYGLNTCGGAIGALLPLWLLPVLGLAAAMQLVALAGLVVALLAWGLGRALTVTAHHEAEGARPPWATLLAYAGVGAAALMLEVGWTRLFGLILLRTEYVMAVILAVFLLGIGIGSLLARRMMAAWWYTVLPGLAALFALLSLWGLPLLAQWAETAAFDSLAPALLSQGLAIAALTLPVTVLLGAWLPLLARHCGAEASSGAWLYGANSLGAAIGALAGGFMLIPWLGTTTTLVLAALLLFACGMTWARHRLAWSAGLVLLAIAWPVRELPAVTALQPQTHTASRDLYRHEDALGITHVIERQDGQRLLLADLQWMDASSEPAAVRSQQNQVRLPLLLHPRPRTVLFLGLGTGISASAMLDFPGLDATAVELSQGAIEAAAQWFTPVNGGVLSRLHLVRDDARRFLTATDRRYDVIIGDLFHPDLVGRSTLLSRQQFARARARLAPGGVFVQWVAINQFDPDSLAVVLRSFAAVFPDGVSFLDGFRLALVGTAGGRLDAATVMERLAGGEARAASAMTGGEGGWSWLGRYWGPLRAGPGPVQDEWAPRIEFSLPRLRYSGRPAVAEVLDWLIRGRPSVTAAAQALGVGSAAYPDFERGYIATELAARAWLAEFESRPDQAQRLWLLANQANPADRWIGLALADRLYAGLPQRVASGMDEAMALQAVLSVAPGHVDALRALRRLAEARGQRELAAWCEARLRTVSPLDAGLRRRSSSGAH